MQLYYMFVYNTCVGNLISPMLWDLTKQNSPAKYNVVRCPVNISPYHLHFPRFRGVCSKCISSFKPKCKTIRKTAKNYWYIYQRFHSNLNSHSNWLIREIQTMRREFIYKLFFSITLMSLYYFSELIYCMHTQLMYCKYLNKAINLLFNIIICQINVQVL